MSDDVLRFVAADPELLPPVAATDEAGLLLRRAFPAADRVEVRRHDEVRFIDGGVNLEAVRCPACGADLTATWPELMGAAHATGMTERRFELPCCGSACALEALDYDWPVAFGRFSADVWNPGVGWFRPGGEPGREEQLLLERLSAVLGTSVRAIWAHY